MLAVLPVLWILQACGAYAEDCNDAGVCTAQQPAGAGSLLQSAVHRIKSADSPEQKELQFTINTHQEFENLGSKIREAFTAADLAWQEWDPVAIPAGSKNLTGTEYPVVYKITVQRNGKAASDFTDGLETEEERKASVQEAEDLEREEKEVAADNFHEGEQEFSFEVGSTENQALLELDEAAEQINEDALKARRKKNKKQKDWASKAISKLEGEVCTRKVNGKPAARNRRSRAVSCNTRCRNWWIGSCSTSCNCGGWEDIAAICYERCDSRTEIGVWFLCHKHCNGWEDFGITCNEKCNIVPHIGTTCGALYCSRDTGACVAKVAKITLAFIEVFSNFVPGGTAMAGLRTAARVGTKAALKIAIKKAVKDVAKRLARKAKSKLRRYLKKAGRELRSEVQDSLLEGGGEMVAETMIAKTESGALRDAAMEMVAAIDPTGIVSLVNAFQADSCRDKVIGMMPTDDFVDESCPFSVTFSGAEHWQRNRMGTFEMTDEDLDARPVYKNAHGQYLSYVAGNGLWMIGGLAGRNWGGLHSQAQWKYCPTSSGIGTWRVWQGSGWGTPSVRVTSAN